MRPLVLASHGRSMVVAGLTPRLKIANVLASIAGDPSMNIWIAFIALFVIAGASQAQINKCVDASGKTIYSQGPCPKGAKSSSVASAPPVSVSAGKTGDAAKSSGPKTAAELEQEFRKRQQELAEGRKKDDARVAEAKIDRENCDSARRQLAGLEAGGRQSGINEKGERFFMDDAQIEAEKQRARQAVASSCK